MIRSIRTSSTGHVARACSASMHEFADLDTAFLVPCKHCAELMQEQERFCPFCGEAQPVTDSAGHARSDVGPEHSASGHCETLAPRAVQSEGVLQPRAQETPSHPFLALAANEEVISELGILARPGTSWQNEVLRRGGLQSSAGGSLIRDRLLIGIAAALLVLFAIALLHDHFYLERQSDADKLGQYSANVEQVQGALRRGDLSAAARALDVVDAVYANDPDVQKLRQAFDRQVQEQVTKAEQLGNVTQGASREVGPGEPAQAPKVATPAAGIGVADSKQKECNDALVALALCTKS